MQRYGRKKHCRMCAAIVCCIMTATAGAQNAGIKIVVLEGEGAINNIQQSRAKDPVVQVTDDSGAPVREASVTFLLPDTGASAAFADGSRMLTIQTDEKGQAVGRGLHPNKSAGTFQIRVTASYHGATASTVISQVNAEPAAKKSSSKTFLIIALIGGAAAGGLGAALGGKKSGGSTSVGTVITPPATVLVPGTPTIQAPH